MRWLKPYGNYGLRFSLKLLQQQTKKNYPNTKVYKNDSDAGNENEFNKYIFKICENLSDISSITMLGCNFIICKEGYLFMGHLI